MAFIRRGNVRVPRKLTDTIDCRRVDGFPATLFVKDISCFEEYSINDKNLITIIYFTNGSNIAVCQDFAAVDEMCNREAVLS